MFKLLYLIMQLEVTYNLSVSLEQFSEPGAPFAFSSVTPSVLLSSPNSKPELKLFDGLELNLRRCKNFDTLSLFPDSILVVGSMFNDTKISQLVSKHFHNFDAAGWVRNQWA